MMQLVHHTFINYDHTTDCQLFLDQLIKTKPSQNNCLTQEGLSALDLALNHKTQHVIKYILENHKSKFDFNILTQGKTLLHKAV